MAGRCLENDQTTTQQAARQEQKEKQKEKLEEKLKSREVFGEMIWMCREDLS